MNGVSYPSGRVVARKVHEYFSRYREEVRDTSVHLAAIPSAEVIEAVIDAAFWASLRREEGYVPRVSLAILGPDQTSRALVFEHTLRVTPGSLARLSPAVVRPGLHIAVWPFEHELCVWGTVRSIPTFSCVVEVVAPGLLVIKHRPREHSRKFVNIAMLEGEQVKVVDRHTSTLADGPSLLRSLLGSEPPTRVNSISILLELAVSMREHGRGGTLLVVPAESDLWRESIVHPMSYVVWPRFSGLSALIQAREGPRGRRWGKALADAVDLIAGLTAVDGATVITGDYDLLAFGVKIGRRDGYGPVEQVTISEPIEEFGPFIVHPTQLGGTRHLSAMQFVRDQQNALALVASQDGQFTVFSWSPSDNMVYGHRIEALLL